MDEEKAQQDQAETEKQAEIRKCCDSLMTGNPELKNLLKIVETIIFKEDFQIRAGGGRQAKNSEENAGDEGQLQNRIIEMGSIADLINVLVKPQTSHFEPHDTFSDAKDRAEKTKGKAGGASDKNSLSQTEPINFCQAKLKRLINRIMNLLKKSSTLDEETQIKALLRLFGLVKFVQELRFLEKSIPWINKTETLVSLPERIKLLDGCLSYLFGSEFSFYEKALVLYGDDTEELHQLLATVGWLFWDCGLPLKKPTRSMIAKDIKLSDADLDKAKLTGLMFYVHQDEEAIQLIKESFVRMGNNSPQQEAEEWLEQSIRLVDALVLAMAAQELPENKSEPLPGDCVLVKRKMENNLKWPLFFHIVEKVSRNTVYLIDLNPKFTSKGFGLNWVSVVELEASEEQA